MINYVTINPAANTALAFDTYTGADWAAFKANFETSNPTLRLVDIGASAFPSGQNWYSGVGQYQRLPYAGDETFAKVQQNILKNIQLRTEQLEYSGTITYGGHPFPRDHDTRDDVVLLATSAVASSALSAALLPLRVNALDGAEVVIGTVSDAENFALAMLSPLKATYAGQADQLAAVQAMTTITALCQYVDPR